MRGVIQIKKYIVGVGYSAFTMSSDAAQYVVPEGQPPVPGADASIQIMRIRIIVMIFVKLILKHKELLSSDIKK
ncbi:MAG: hypothetical protein ACLTUQ_05745 [Veillonella nakazawae]